MQAFDTGRYLSDILPQAKRQRRADEATKRTFYEQVKRHVAQQGVSASDYERVLKSVVDALDY